MTKLEATNVVMNRLVKGSMLSRDYGGWFVSWKVRESQQRYRYITRKGSHYPVWSRHWPAGGTSYEALYQLVRWNRGQPVLPISTWRYWASDTIKLITNKELFALEYSFYPPAAKCVLCGTTIRKGTGLDWWDLDGVEGPCCGYSRLAPKGCRQRTLIQEATT